MNEIKEYEKYFDEHVEIKEFDKKKSKFTPWKEIERRINEKIDKGEIKTYYDILKEIGYDDWQISDKTRNYLAKPIFGTNVIDVIDVIDEYERSKKKIESLQKDYERLEEEFKNYKRKVEENNKKGEK